MAAGDLTFHAFPLLPPELRAQIWTEHLHDATPLVYRFKIQYNLRSRVKSGWCDGDLYRYNAQPDDTVILEPAGPYFPFDPPAKFQDRQTLALSTLAARSALATCLESREVAQRLLPDSLSFRILPRRWTDGTGGQEHPSDGTGYTEYILRFNGARDIVIFHANWEDQGAVTEIAKLHGAPAAFSQMQHIGLTVGSLDFGHGMSCGMGRASYGVAWDECRCSTAACSDVCQLEPLPGFLANFPSLRTFYIARISDDIADYGDSSDSVFTRLEDASCRCEPRAGSDGLNHAWPTFKSADTDRWCVAWDERTGCFPTQYIITDIRLGWRSHFPYYQALEHLDIKFLRRLDPNIGP